MKSLKDLLYLLGSLKSGGELVSLLQMTKAARWTAKASQITSQTFKRVLTFSCARVLQIRMGMEVGRFSGSRHSVNACPPLFALGHVIRHLTRVGLNFEQKDWLRPEYTSILSFFSFPFVSTIVITCSRIVVAFVVSVTRLVCMATLSRKLAD